MRVLARRSIAAVHDPWVRSAVTLVVLACGAFVLFAVSWRGVARTIYVPYQLPWLVSAGFVALAVIGGSLGALTIHIGRRQDALERAQFEDFVIDLTEMAHEVTAGRRTLAGRSGPEAAG